MCYVCASMRMKCWAASHRTSLTMTTIQRDTVERTRTRKHRQHTLPSTSPARRSVCLINGFYALEIIVSCPCSSGQYLQLLAVLTVVGCAKAKFLAVHNCRCTLLPLYTRFAQLCLRLLAVLAIASCACSCLQLLGVAAIASCACRC